MTRITVSPLILPNSFLILSKKWVATNARQEATLIFRAQRAKRSAVTPSHHRVCWIFAVTKPAPWMAAGRRSSHATTVTGRIEHRHDAAVPRCVTFKGASFPRPHTTCIWAVSSVQGLIRRNVIVQGSHFGWQRPNPNLFGLGPTIDNPRSARLGENARAKTYRTLPSVSTRALRLPTMFWGADLVRDGGLIGYGPNQEETARLHVQQVVRVLKGAAPGQLPVLQPTRFELVINLGTAKSIGVIIPQSLLARADEVIE